MRNTLYKAYLEDFYKFCQVYDAEIWFLWSFFVNSVT
jgi:vacuolar-type H+-ATPase subunit C/Vma6